VTKDNQIDPWSFHSEAPGQIIPGVWDALTGLTAREAGAKRLFLSGGALAISRSLPDLGLVSVDTLANVARSIVQATKLPLIVDAEVGGGSFPVLGYQVEQLMDAGVRAILLEDQEFTGQSVLAANAGLCSPSTMVDRIRLAKRVGGSSLRILARTDIPTPTWPFNDSLDRMKRYLDAGADWVTPVRPRSKDDLARTAEIAGSRVMMINGKGDTGYLASHADVVELGFCAYIVAKQHSTIIGNMIDAYRISLEGKLAQIDEQQIDRAVIARMIGAQRHFDNLTASKS
jgi:2-methylisocitrate lyase-like PEP mutase family enzyme